jgi:hypothetical protein
MQKRAILSETWIMKARVVECCRLPWTAVECRLVKASTGPIAGQLWASQHAMRRWETGAAKPIARRRWLPVVQRTSKGEHNVSRRFRAGHKRSAKQRRAKTGPSLTPQLLRGAR